MTAPVSQVLSEAEKEVARANAQRVAFAETGFRGRLSDNHPFVQQAFRAAALAKEQGR